SWEEGQDPGGGAGRGGGGPSPPRISEPLRGCRWTLRRPSFSEFCNSIRKSEKDCLSTPVSREFLRLSVAHALRRLVRNSGRPFSHRKELGYGPFAAGDASGASGRRGSHGGPGVLRGRLPAEEGL